MLSCKRRVGVIGATSIVGEYLLPSLVEEGWDVVAFSRRKQNIKPPGDCPVTWQLLAQSKLTGIRDIYQQEKQIPFWIILAPILVLPEYLSMLVACGAKHVVAVSSTSRFTKRESSDSSEKKLADDLAESEEFLAAMATNEKFTFTILRPTLIYGLGRDKNISVIAAFIRRFAFFCVFGAARGLRQPVHAQDVASCCVTALCSEAAVNHSYNISGGEIINYREMVCRIFHAVDKKPRFLEFPLWLFRLAVFILRIFPPYRQWSAAMAQRMNQDMVFDHAKASRDLNFSPRNFRPDKTDLRGN
jgi:nucleoside-diphosphate-sugar epimerase